MNLWRLFWAFVQLGTMAFGGGYAIIVIAERLFVQKLKWITEKELMDYLAMSQSLSGIIALNFSGFIGYKKAGPLGALLAILGVLFTPFCVVLLIAGFMGTLTHHPVLMSALWGVKIAVCALILSMAIRLMKECFKNALSFIVFALTLLLYLGFHLSPVIPIVLAGGFGVFYWMRFKKVFNE